MNVYYEDFGGKDIETKSPFKISLWPKDSRVDHSITKDPLPLPGRIQKLISSEEYADFEDEIIVEDQFVELDKFGEPLRPVFLGLTKKSVFIAVDDLPDIRFSRATVLNGRDDSESEELELQWVAPLFLVDISMILDEEILSVKTAMGYKRYFLLSSTRGGGDRDLNWLKWIMNIENVNKDIEGYVQEMREKWDIEDIGDMPESGTNLFGTKSMVRSLQRLGSKLINKTDIMTFRSSIGNSLIIPLDLYDTSGIIHSESKTKTSCFSCFRHRKKHRKKKGKR